MEIEGAGMKILQLEKNSSSSVAECSAPPHPPRISVAFLGLGIRQGSLLPAAHYRHQCCHGIGLRMGFTVYI
jgi:hypothetical protein